MTPFLRIMTVCRPFRAIHAATLAVLVGVSVICALPGIAAAQGWDPTVTITPTVQGPVEIGPLPFVLKRPIPVRQARRQTGHRPLSANDPVAALPAPPPKPPIWTTAATGLPAPAPPPSVIADSPSKPAAALLMPTSNFVRQYCVSVADAAADARYAWQKKTLTEMEQELAKRIELLEAKVAETRNWLARRDEFSKKARDGLVLIYARMRADAAAAQLSAMDEETAAAVLNKLDPRNASLIMSEMPPAQAARLTAIISGAARVSPADGKTDGQEKRS